MSRGGHREGAGRPKGAVSRSNEEVRLKAAETGELPLDYMLKILRDPNADEARRDDMAKAAAPYLHAKLASASVTISGDKDNPLVHIHENMSEQEAISAYQQIRNANREIIH